MFVQNLENRARGIAPAVLNILEIVAGWAGWLFASLLVGTSAQLWAMGRQVAELRLGFSFAAAGGLVGLSMLRRGVPAWAGDIGLSVASWTASASAAIGAVLWFENESVVGPASAGALSLALFLVCAWLRPEQIRDRWVAFRRWLDGMRDDGRQPNVFELALVPLVVVALLGFAIMGALDPDAMVRHLMPIRQGIEQARSAQLPKGGGLVGPMPAWVSSAALWTGASAVLAVALYIALRRAGGGSTWRGTGVWLLALGLVGGAVIAVLALLIAGESIEAGSPATSWGSALAIGTLSGALACGCYAVRSRVGGRE